jgi:hypothetical protein
MKCVAGRVHGLQFNRGQLSSAKPKYKDLYENTCHTTYSYTDGMKELRVHSMIGFTFMIN